MNRIGYLSIIGLLVLAAAGLQPARAQAGPQVPCAGCPDLAFRPKPETGLWNNPLDPTGTGFMLEVQGQRLAGFLFIYDEAGEPEWFLLAGTLAPGPEDGEALWVVEADLTRFAGGPCINCPSQPAMVSGSGGTVRFEFLARNFARFRIDDGPYENLVPLTFGVATEAVFPQATDYRLPDLEGRWVFVLNGESLTDELGRDRGDALVTRWTRQASPGDGTEATVRYDIRRALDFGPVGTPPPGDLQIGVLECTKDTSTDPMCTFSFTDFLALAPLSYKAPLPNVGDSYILAEADEGFALRAIRVFRD